MFLREKGLHQHFAPERFEDLVRQLTEFLFLLFQDKRKKNDELEFDS
jgi:hypothetical protein